MTQADFDNRIYQKLPQIVLGFHGCDESVVDRVIQSPTEHLRHSKNDYDWLGNGIYFWLNDPQRAYEWACQSSKMANSRVKNPAVVGAVIDLGTCLNFCERESVLLLQNSYDSLKNDLSTMGLDIKDVLKNTKPDEGGFTLKRELDCAVIENLHSKLKKEGISFDTVYGYFQEGDKAFPGSDILKKSHIQICVRNNSCIKGYFIPRLK